MPTTLYTPIHKSCFGFDCSQAESETENHVEFWCGISAKELFYVKSFALGVENWAEDLALNQLRCLWTSYCFHQNMTVDTFAYDNELMQVWQDMHGAGEAFADYESFCSFMAAYLV